MTCCTDQLNSPTSVKQDLEFYRDDVNMSSQGRSFSTEYKVETAHQVIDSGRSVVEVAPELGGSEHADALMNAAKADGHDITRIKDCDHHENN